MNHQLITIECHNYRSLADISIKPNNINVLFGANGVGKSTFLDIIWFLRDCVVRGVEFAASQRDHGIGLLWDQVEANNHIIIKLENNISVYEISFDYSSGRIASLVGEKLIDKSNHSLVFERNIGSDKVILYNQGNSQTSILKENQLALTRYVQLTEVQNIASPMYDSLKNVRLFSCRLYSLYQLKRLGSESNYGYQLEERAENLWSVLRNLHDKQVVDPRYEIIIKFMQEAFPNFENIYFEQIGRFNIYANFVEKNRRKPIQASGISDGYLQLLINLTVLFSEGKNHTIILMDEPEISLHPWGLVVFSKAVKLAIKEWNKQIFIATHHPVLLSQFDEEDIFIVELDHLAKTVIKRVSELNEVRDLLTNYPLGSLYMAQAIAPQTKPNFEEVLL